MPSPRGPAAAHGQAVLDMQGFAAPSGLRPVSPQPRSPQTGVSEDSARHRRRPSPGSSPETEQTVQDTTELAEKVAEQVAKSLMPALKSQMEALRPKSEPRAMIPLEAVDRVSDGVAMALGNRLQTLEEQMAEVAALAPLLAGLRPLPTLDMKELQSPFDKVELQEFVGLLTATGQQWEHALPPLGLRQCRGF
ncbi:unnamed protein product [Symbiodinium sp. CCMP2592]|nr:unnamed protein product [Symbiodinium sp. CCMP2592]